MKILMRATALLLVLAAPCFSQTGGNGSATKITITPGARYEAGWLRKLILGSNWRDMWTTPLEVEVLDLQQFDGGLTPTKRGGGRQTQSLTFTSAEGRKYRFRSIDKDPSMALPPEYRESIAADILQDQISCAHPLAPVIVAPLLSAVEVLSPEPRIVVLPKDSRLGEFEEEFGGMLGTFEENLKERSDDDAGPADADKLVQTMKLFNRLESDPDHHIAATEYLKARLMDIFIGDWDRHQGQWRWAGFRDGDRWLWKPVPRDRDWAFSRFGGLIPWVVTMVVPPLKGFEDEYPGMGELTWDARHIDRRLLVSVDWRQWDSVTAFVVGRLTDSVIREAAHRMPPEMYSLEGKYLEEALIARRNDLTRASREFYGLATKFPDIRGTKKAEYCGIHRSGDSVRVSLFRRDKESGGIRGETPLFDRTFRVKETKDIRVYLLGGDDKVVVDGEGTGGITLRVIGGDGRDEFVSSSPTATHVYDSDANTLCEETEGIDWDRDSFAEPENDSLRYDPIERDFGHMWRFQPWYGFSPDDGVFLGGGPILYDYDFRMNPYRFRMQLIAGYATAVRKGRLDYTGEFYSVFEDARLLVHVRASQLEHTKFFGFGNESPFDDALQRDGYYDIDQEQAMVQTTVEFHPASSLTVSVGGSVTYVESELDTGTFMAQYLPSEDDKSRLLGGVEASIAVDTRNVASSVATSGILWQVGGSYAPIVFDNERQFGRLSSDFRAYMTESAVGPATLALRVGGEKVWGVYPYYASALLGGAGNLRGFAGQRFAGDASVFASAELRLHVSDFSFLFPGRFGLLGFGDGGRVYISGETSDLWHSALGGGVWFSMIRPEYTLSVAVARSTEQVGVYVMTGFSF